MAGTGYKGSRVDDVDHFLKGGGLDSEREQTIGQHIGYRYDVNLLPDYGRLTPFLKDYLEYMGWDDLNWLEDVHMGYDDGQHIGYRYDVNLLPDYDRLTPFLKDYMEFMGWDDLNWLEDVHMGYDDGRPAVFDRNINGWVEIPDDMELPDNQQERDMIAREMLVRFQMSPDHPLVDLYKAYRKF